MTNGEVTCIAVGDSIIGWIGAAFEGEFTVTYVGPLRTAADGERERWIHIEREGADMPYLVAGGDGTIYGPRNQ